MARSPAAALVAALLIACGAQDTSSQADSALHDLDSGAVEEGDAPALPDDTAQGGDDDGQVPLRLPEGLEKLR